MIRKILIANRGEIACRIARTCRKLGIAVAGVHSTADAHALHVREIGESHLIGGAAPSESYLDINAILRAAEAAGADAIHPGFGFLSEEPAFAAAVERAGLVFIGPTPDTLRDLGRKDSAKQIAQAAGVPTVPGSQGATEDAARLIAQADEIGFPLLLKAAAGGGGRGMRVVADAAALPEAIASAMREARGAFGSPALIAERFIPRGRHIEVQIAGDGAGGVIHLFERECTLQRRHQKVIEEAPAAPLPEGLRDALLDDACKIARRMSFRNLGTVEFIVTGTDYFFLEVNPRLQVEHPVTEEITGLDLVALQIALAEGRGLPCPQDALRATGHAVEARLYAEDAAQNFAPSTGRLRALHLPSSARIEAGVAAGDEITPHYDPMIAKIVTTGQDRATALAAMEAALAETSIHGVTTNLDFLGRIVALQDTRAGTFWTTLIDSLPAADTSAPDPDAFAIAVSLWLNHRRGAAGRSPWTGWGPFTGWQIGYGGASLSDSPVLLASAGDRAHPVRLGRLLRDGTLAVEVGGETREVSLTHLDDGRWHISAGGKVIVTQASVDGETVLFETPAGQMEIAVKPWLGPDEDAVVGNGRCEAPLMGQIIEVRVAVGDEVEEGATIAVMESMKMEMRVSAPVSGRIEFVTTAGEMVKRGAILAEIAALESAGA